jgi:hypothetical protein
MGQQLLQRANMHSDGKQHILGAWEPTQRLSLHPYPQLLASILGSDVEIQSFATMTRWLE